ncbi:MAG: hypothetical protein ACFFCS_09235 [Candidatus Hodarchaeota archaeon]
MLFQLEPREMILKASSGAFIEEKKVRGIIIITNLRLLFFSRKLNEMVAFDQVESHQKEPGIKQVFTFTYKNGTRKSFSLKDKEKWSELFDKIKANAEFKGTTRGESIFKVDEATFYEYTSGKRHKGVLLLTNDKLSFFSPRIEEAIELNVISNAQVNGTLLVYLYNRSVRKFRVRRASRWAKEINKVLQTVSGKPVEKVIIKEVTKEVVKIKCPYCHELVEVTRNKCPNCNGNIV